MNAAMLYSRNWGGGVAEWRGLNVGETKSIPNLLLT